MGKRNTWKFEDKKQDMTNHKKRLPPTIQHHYNTYKSLISYKQYYIFEIPLTIGLTFSTVENIQWLKIVKNAKKLFKSKQKEYYKQFH